MLEWPQYQLNRRAAALVKDAADREAELRIESRATPVGARVFDFGVNVAGGLEAGVTLAQVCLSGLGRVQIRHGFRAGAGGCVPHVEVQTDHPVAACLLSQYAGWQIADDDYYAMGSGPMRTTARREPLFGELNYSENVNGATSLVGVLETSALPPIRVVMSIAEATQTEPKQVLLLAAPTSSQAGNIQIVARSVETAMHKLHTLEFPMDCVVSGFGSAPLPPVAGDDLTGIGRTNDAILYGAEVSLWVRCEDHQIEEIGRRVPSDSSPAHGRSFLELFRDAGNDFYAIDPNLFSPAVVTFNNLASGNSFRFGEVIEDLVPTAGTRF